MKPKVIWDLGANAGMNLDYFLYEADLVVAVEANPLLVDQIVQRFAAPIDKGQLVVVNAAITLDDTSTVTPFFVHQTNSVLSQLPEPPLESRSEFREIQVGCVSLARLIRDFGIPYYVKIDLESFDSYVLRELFALGVFPTFVSAEAHSPEVLEILIKDGGYTGFTLVNGASVHLRYRWHRIRTPEGNFFHRFPLHSSGPFGGDLPGPWYSPDGIQGLLRLEGFGWKDLHATNMPMGRLRNRPSQTGWKCRRLGRSTVALLGSWRESLMSPRRNV